MVEWKVGSYMARDGKELTIAKPKPWLYSTVERQFGVVAAVSRHLFISMTYVAISACLLLFV